jgi:flavin-dependent dehydrogenase
MNLVHHFVMREFEAVIIGAGPAGCAAAISLARAGRRVALFEASRFDVFRYGETLPPELTPLLRQMGLWDSFRALNFLESPGNVSCWGSELWEEHDFVRNPHGCGWHVDRLLFDQMLCRAAEQAGAVVMRAARITSCSRLPQGWHLTSSGPGGLEVSAEVVVDTCGRNGFRLGRMPNYEIDDSLVAIAFRSRGATTDLRTYVESISCGWWYSSPLPGGEMMAMLFTDTALYKNEGIAIGPLLDQSPLTRRRLVGAVLEDTRVLHVRSAIRAEIAGARWFAAGDSAMSFDPISGSGVFHALRYGAIAGEAAHAFLNGDGGPAAAYPGKVRFEFDRYRRTRCEYYSAEMRWPDSLFWRNRTSNLVAIS